MKQQLNLFPELASPTVVDLAFGRKEITDENLRHLSSVELDVICTLMGIPKNGTKSRKINRILDLWDLRQTLKDYESSYDGAKKLADSYKRKELYDFAKRTKGWKSGNKIGLASSLLGWRDRCRQKGYNFFNETKKYMRAQ